MAVGKAPRRRFARADRLLRSREFQAASRSGRRAVNRDFVLITAPSQRRDGIHGPRLGVTVSRKIGGAVQRNYVKRRIREWFRQARPGLPDLDLVVIGRRGCAQRSGCEIAESLESLSRRGRGRR